MSSLFNHFANPWAFALLPLVPVILWLALGAEKKRPTVQFSGLDVARDLPITMRQRIMALMPWSRALVLVLGICALARPQYGTVEFSTNSLGVDIAMIIDVSGSMQEQDYLPNRLEAAKVAARSFAKNRTSDRVTLVVFAASAALLLPPTLDMAAVDQFIAAIQQDMINGQATAVGDGLALGLAKLKDSTAKSKIAVLLTDGDSNTGRLTPEQAGEMARAFGVKVYAIGVGRGSGGNNLGMFGPMPGQGVGFNEDVLRSIADKTGGKYYRSTNEETLKAIYAEIDQLEKTEIEVQKSADYDERFYWFWYPALALLGLEFVLRGLWLRRIP